MRHGAKEVLHARPISNSARDIHPTPPHWSSSSSSELQYEELRNEGIPGIFPRVVPRHCTALQDASLQPWHPCKLFQILRRREVAVVVAQAVGVVRSVYAAPRYQAEVTEFFEAERAALDEGDQFFPMALRDALEVEFHVDGIQVV